ncbi:MAG: hypothetical protein ACOY5C_04475 [Pseudomonadota bacterium]
MTLKAKVNLIRHRLGGCWEKLAGYVVKLGVAGFEKCHAANVLPHPYSGSSNRYIHKWPDVLPTGGAKDSALARGAKGAGNRLRGGTAAALPLRLVSRLERQYR